MSRARTRIKICGLTRPEDVDVAVELGVDAIGFVFYPPSPRYLEPARAALLARRLPPFVSAVGLFVNAGRDQIRAVLDQVPIDLLQFHGDETPADCAGHDRPWFKAARIGGPSAPAFDLVEFASRHAGARAILLDALVDGYGGGGKVFDWSVIPRELAPRAVLSGGLNAQNVAEAIARVAPAAVDVSSGVEAAKGIKDHDRMRAFVAAVRAADAQPGGR